MVNCKLIFLPASNRLGCWYVIVAISYVINKAQVTLNVGLPCKRRHFLVHLYKCVLDKVLLDEARCESWSLPPGYTPPLPAAGQAGAPSCDQPRPEQAQLPRREPQEKTDSAASKGWQVCSSTC